MYQLGKQAVHVRGDVAEVCVYRGGTVLLLSTLLLGSGKRLHLFDTFEGMPDTASGDQDFHRPGEFSDTSLPRVQAFIGTSSDIEFHAGFFPATAPAESHLEFCFVLSMSTWTSTNP